MFHIVLKFNFLLTYYFFYTKLNRLKSPVTDLLSNHLLQFISKDRYKIYVNKKIRSSEIELRIGYFK